jgi:hypothetical protein
MIPVTRQFRFMTGMLLFAALVSIDQAQSQREQLWVKLDILSNRYSDYPAKRLTRYFVFRHKHPRCPGAWSIDTSAAKLERLTFNLTGFRMHFFRLRALSAVLASID